VARACANAAGTPTVATAAQKNKSDALRRPIRPIAVYEIAETSNASHVSRSVQPDSQLRAPNLRAHYHTP